jgi:hypothetical protein
MCSSSENFPQARHYSIVEHISDHDALVPGAAAVSEFLVAGKRGF